MYEKTVLVSAQIGTTHNYFSSHLSVCMSVQPPTSLSYTHTLLLSLSLSHRDHRRQDFQQGRAQDSRCDGRAHCKEHVSDAGIGCAFRAVADAVRLASHSRLRLLFTLPLLPQPLF